MVISLFLITVSQLICFMMSIIYSERDFDWIKALNWSMSLNRKANYKNAILVFRMLNRNFLISLMTCFVFIYAVYALNMWVVKNNTRLFFYFKPCCTKLLQFILLHCFALLMIKTSMNLTLYCFSAHLFSSRWKRLKCTFCNFI